MRLQLRLQGSITLNAGWLTVDPGFLGRHDAARPRRAFLDNHTVQTSTDAWQTSQNLQLLSESSSNAARTRAVEPRQGSVYNALHYKFVLKPATPSALSSIHHTEFTDPPPPPLFDGRLRDLKSLAFQTLFLTATTASPRRTWNSLVRKHPASHCLDVPPGVLAPPPR